MPTRIPLSFSRWKVTKIPARNGWVYVTPERDRFRITATGRPAELVQDQRDIHQIVREFIDMLGGPVPYMPGPPGEYESLEDRSQWPDPTPEQAEVLARLWADDKNAEFKDTWLRWRVNPTRAIKMAPQLRQYDFVKQRHQFEMAEQIVTRLLEEPVEPN